MGSVGEEEGRALNTVCGNILKPYKNRYKVGTCTSIAVYFA